MKNSTVVILTCLVLILVSCKAGKKSTPNYGKTNFSTRTSA